MRRGLYAIVDGGALGDRDAIAFTRRILEKGPLFAVQLRAKQWSAARTLSAARLMARICEQAETPFFVNDRPDLAMLAGAFGVHVGQDDLTPSEVRSVGPTLRVGRSTHSLSQALAAAHGDELDYVALGPVFATGSKANPDPVVGLEVLRQVVAQGLDAAIVAIGGITLERAVEVRSTGANAGAVIAELATVHDDTLATVARESHIALGGE